MSNYYQQVRDGFQPTLYSIALATSTTSRPSCSLCTAKINQSIKTNLSP